MQKTIFITGASSGLGKAVAFLFASRGWKVIATMRNPGAALDLASKANITVLPLDVTDTSQVAQTVSQVVALGRIDVVLNNAGYGMFGPFEGVSNEDLRRQIDTNLLGVMRVTQAFIPHFRENSAGVFIAVTSVGGLVTFPFFSVYHATKWAIEGWNESLAFEMAPFGIRAKTVAPGRISSEFRSSLRRTEHPAYAALFKKAVIANDTTGSPSTAEQIAEVVYEAATDGKSRVHYVAGTDAKILVRIRRLLGTKWFIELIRRRVFA